MIAVDGGSTDSGPHYLGTATAKTARAAVARTSARSSRPPQRRDPGHRRLLRNLRSPTPAVDWVRHPRRGIAEREHADPRERTASTASRTPPRSALSLEPARIRPLQAAGQLGRHPAVAARTSSADRPRTDRRRPRPGRGPDPRRPSHRHRPDSRRPTDTGPASRPGLARRQDRRVRRPVHHRPRSGGVLVTVDHDGFTVEPLDPAAACTPTSVAAHMMYENADPFRMREPTEPSTRPTPRTPPSTSGRSGWRDRAFSPPGSTRSSSKARPCRLPDQTSSSGIADPRVLAGLDEWCDQLLAYLPRPHPATIGLRTQRLRHPAAALRSRRRARAPSHARAPPPRSASCSSPPPPTRRPRPRSPSSPTRCSSTHRSRGEPLPSYAFLGSPAEIERGQIHEFRSATPSTSTRSTAVPHRLRTVGP